MAITRLGLLGSGVGNTAALTLDVVNTSGAIIPAGTLMHISGVWDNVSATAPTLSCSAVGGVTPISVHAVSGSGATGSAGAGIFHQCFRALTTADIAVGATICTITSNQSAVKRAAVATGYSGAVTTQRSTQQTITSTTGVLALTQTGTAPVAGDVVIFTGAFESSALGSSDTDTLNGSWSTMAGVSSTGTTAAAVSIGVQAKVVTAGGFQTVNSTGASADAVGCVATFQPLLPSLGHAASRLYADGTEAGSVALFAQNSNGPIDVGPGDQVVLLRVLLQSGNAIDAPSTDDWQLAYEKNGVGGNINITSSSSVVASYVSANLTEGEPTTHRLTGGTGTYEPGKVSEDGLVDNLGLASLNFTELLYSIVLKKADLVAGDILRFKVIRDGNVIGGTLPRFDITKSAGGTSYTATAALAVTTTATALARATRPISALPTDLSSTDWDKSGSATATSTRVTIPSGVATGSYALSDDIFVLNGGRVLAKMAATPTAGYTELSIWGASLYTSIGVDNGQIYASQTPNWHGLATWDAAKPWLAIREEAGVLYFERSATGAPGTWEVLDTMTTTGMVGSILLGAANTTGATWFEGVRGEAVGGASYTATASLAVTTSRTAAATRTTSSTTAALAVTTSRSASATRSTPAAGTLAVTTDRTASATRTTSSATNALAVTTSRTAAATRTSAPAAATLAVTTTATAAASRATSTTTGTLAVTTTAAAVATKAGAGQVSGTLAVTTSRSAAASRTTFTTTASLAVTTSRTASAVPDKRVATSVLVVTTSRTASADKSSAGQVNASLAVTTSATASATSTKRTGTVSLSVTTSRTATASRSTSVTTTGLAVTTTRTASASTVTPQTVGGALGVTTTASAAASRSTYTSAALSVSTARTASLSVSSGEAFWYVIVDEEKRWVVNQWVIIDGEKRPILSVGVIVDEQVRSTV